MKYQEIFLKLKKYGLTSQILRASYSVPMNIAEGSGYSTDKEMGRFLKFSAGSISEIEYCLMLAKDLKYIAEVVSLDLIDEAISIRKMIFKFNSNLK